MRYQSVVDLIKTTRKIVPNSIKGDTSIMVTVEYRDQIFDGHKAFASLLYFFDNKLLHCEIFFRNKPEDDKGMIQLYDSIKTSLTLKYFEPQFCENAKEYLSPFQKMKAIKEDATKYYCNWFFPKDETTEKDGKLDLIFTKEGHIVLLYDYAKAYRNLNSGF